MEGDTKTGKEQPPVKLGVAMRSSMAGLHRKWQLNRLESVWIPTIKKACEEAKTPSELSVRTLLTYGEHENLRVKHQVIVPIKELKLEVGEARDAKVVHTLQEKDVVFGELYKWARDQSLELFWERAPASATITGLRVVWEWI